MNSPLGQIEIEKALQQAEVDKAVAQGKLELAADILHDIGNAIVGFGSYLTRIRRSMEQNPADNLTTLTSYCAGRQADIGTALGPEKAAALVTMLQSITESQQTAREEIGKSIVEQLRIITHVQEILSIQRQYAAGHETRDKIPVNLRAVIEDCLSMVFASI
jgi:signal transduction histidine kinase